MDKQTLRQYRKIVAKIADLSAERAMIYGLRFPGTDGERVSSSTTSDPTMRAAEALDRIDAVLADKIAEMVDLRIEIERVIDALPPDDYRLMHLRYIEGNTWEQVAVTLGYDYRHTTKKHGKILGRLRENGLMD